MRPYFLVLSLIIPAVAWLAGVVVADMLVVFERASAVLVGAL